MEDAGLSIVKKVCEGRYIFSQGSIIETEHGVFKERSTLGNEGCVIATVSIDSNEKCLATAPCVTSRGWLNDGLASTYEGQIEEELLIQLNVLLGNRTELVQDDLAQKVRRVTGTMVNELTKRRPMIIPIVNIIS